MSGARVPTEFEHLVDWLRAMPAKVRGEGVRAAAEAVEDVASVQHKRGQSPEGAAWPPRKVDGAVALKRPTRQIIWQGSRGAIRAAADDVLEHHRRRRPVFPGGKNLPPAWLRAAEAALRRVLERGAPK